MKIFGIGLSNTGTRSLAKALMILNYKVIHYPWSMDDIRKHEASLDITVSCRYKELDLTYPNSKFILTIRPLEEWIQRRKTKPADDRKPPFWKLEARRLLYGSETFDENLYRKSYCKYHEEVFRYFKNRKDDLLVLSLDEKNKWILLCNFLNKKIPNVKYPWEGKHKFKFL